MTALTGVPWPPPTQLGERIRLRAAGDLDRKALIELLTSEPARRHLGGPLSPVDAEQAMRGALGHVAGSFVAVRVSDGEFLGTVGFDRRDRGRPGHLSPDGGELEVSYTFSPKHWGQGLATESLRLALRWATDTVPDDPVVACTQATNVASLRLLRRLGFVEVDQFTEFGADQILLTCSL